MDLHFNESEFNLLCEALHRLRETKVEAHAALIGLPGHERFTQRDFGIPDIDTLLEKLDAAESGQQALALES